MKRSVFIITLYSLLKILLSVLLFVLPAASVVALWIKIVFAIIVGLDICFDISIFVNCRDIVKEHTEVGKFIWKDRKRTFLGLPWSFTIYKLSNEKLIVDSGFLNTKESEIRLYRITDLDLSCNFGQRLLGVGTITVHSSDKSDSVLVLESIKRPGKVKELISDTVEKERIKKRVSGREIIDSNIEHTCHEDDDSIENEIL